MRNLLQERRRDYYYRLPRKLRAAFWSRADMGIARATGVSQWNDQSGNNRHLVQATTIKQPPYNRIGGPRGHAYVGTFDGVDDFLRGTWTMVQPLHAFSVATPTVAGTTAGGPYFIDGSSGLTFAHRSLAASTIGIHAGVGLSNSPVAAVNVWQRIETKFSGASSFVKVNDDIGVTGDAGTNNPNGIILGMFGDQVSAPLDCRIADLSVFIRILSNTEFYQMRTYLRGRYGI